MVTFSQVRPFIQESIFAGEKYIHDFSTGISLAFMCLDAGKQSVLMSVYDQNTDYLYPFILFNVDSSNIAADVDNVITLKRLEAGYMYCQIFGHYGKELRLAEGIYLICDDRPGTATVVLKDFDGNRLFSLMFSAYTVESLRRNGFSVDFCCDLLWAQGVLI